MKFAQILLASSFCLAALSPASGCALVPGDQVTPTPKPAARSVKPFDRPTVVVKRSSIVESIKLLGRVAAVREADLYFPNAGRVKNVSVRPGQDVTAGMSLVELDTGDLAQRVAQAQVNLETAQVKVQQADAQRAQRALQRESDLAAATLAEQQAEAAVSKAEADLVAVKAGPSPVETAQAAVRDAQSQLDNARRSLALTQNSPTVTNNVSDRENERNWYEVNYAETLQRFGRGETSQDEVDRQHSNLAAARQRYETAKIQAESTLAQARDAVTKAEDQLRKAQVDLAAKQAMPPDSHVKDAERVVANARLALNKAKTDLTLKQTSREQEYDYQLLVKAVAQATTTLQDLKSQLQNATLVAPFGGKATAVRVKIGDQVSAYQIVISMADPAELEVRGDLMDNDIPRVAVGQDVDLTVDAMSGVAIKGAVVAVPSGLTAQNSGLADRTLRIKVNWPGGGPQLGQLARVTVTAQKKDNVLVVPARAVKTVGKRHFVEYYDGTLRRSQNVELGIVTESEAEILSGLTDGQTILAGQ